MGFSITYWLIERLAIYVMWPRGLEVTALRFWTLERRNQGVFESHWSQPASQRCYNQQDVIFNRSYLDLKT